MIIEIRKAGFVNKGAELMQYAILEKMRANYPNAIFTMAPSYHDPSRHFHKMATTGFYPKAWLPHVGLQLGHLAKFIPRRLREMYGVILDREVNFVIDAAGFAYSDQWGERYVRELAQSAARWRRQGTKVILMPQAFGPFTGTRIRKAIQRAADNIDLIMPRDQRSYSYLTEVVGDLTNIRKYPDFTNLVEGLVPKYFDKTKHGVCLVPNHRMVDKTSGPHGAAYLPLMTRIAQNLVDRMANPFVLIHEGEKDIGLAEKISKASGGIPILIESDPIKIKGILGASYATIGSRFHGLVSALSQGVPSLATGWSHKYGELFNDYGFPQGIVSVNDPSEIINEKIDGLIDKEIHADLSQRLIQRSERLKAQSEAMWNDVLTLMK